MKLGKRKCVICKVQFHKTRPIQPCCSYECNIAHSNALVQKKRAKIWKEEKSVLKSKLTTRSDYEKQLEKIVNETIREIDKGCGCISCGTLKAKFSAGHYHSVGSNRALRFNFLNVWNQCYQCNGQLGGNLHQYDINLIELYGREKWEYLKFDLVRLYPIRKTPMSDYPELITQARNLLSQSKKLKANQSPVDRWRIRCNYNLILGIYLESF